MAPLSRSELFLVDPNDFVARRNDLARELRAGGDKDGAAAVKVLRRPSVAVWALNQVAQEHADLAHALIDAATAGEAAQRALLEGKPTDDFRAVVSRRRDAMSAVADAAAGIVGRSGRTPETYAREVDGALNAIVAASDALDAFARSELVAVPEPSGEGEMFAGIVPPPMSAPTSASTKRAAVAEGARARPAPKAAAITPPGLRPPSARLVKAREQVAQHRDDVVAAEHDLETADTGVAEAREQVEVAQRDLRRAEAERDRVRSRLDRTRDQVARSEELVERYES